MIFVNVSDDCCRAFDERTLRNLNTHQGQNGNFNISFNKGRVLTGNIIGGTELSDKEDNDDDDGDEDSINKSLFSSIITLMIINHCPYVSDDVKMKIIKHNVKPYGVVLIQTL